ncbi:MAG: hypothetical protein H0W42_02975 [Gemmatimonadaceae bacterium]|nr:hypothetical protein [Gemmatimonadaceae bacterium]
MIRKQANQRVGAQMINALDGSAFVGSVTVVVTVDAGTQTAGAGGVCVHEGGGYFTYSPTVNESDGNLIAFTFSGAGAVPQTVQIYTRARATGSSGTEPTPFPIDAPLTDKGLILDALKMCGLIPAAVEDADPSLMAIGQRQLRRLIGEWALQPLTMFGWTRRVFPLTAGVSEYTIGPGGDFDTPRPSLGIEWWSIIPNRNDTQPYEIARRRPRTMLEWRRIGMKDMASELPTDLIFDGSIDVGRNTIAIYPVPTTSDVDLILYQRETIATMQDGVDYAFPEGYESALLSNLAVKLKQFFPDAMLDPQVSRDAVSTLYLIKRQNWTAPEVFGNELPGTRRGHYNIYADEYTGGR